MSEQVIEIPSKRIYDNQNPKIIKNKYAAASLDMKNSSREMKYSEVVGGVDEYAETSNLQELVPTVVHGYTGNNRPIGWCEIEAMHQYIAKSSANASEYDIIGVFSGLTSRYHSVTFTVPKKQDYDLTEVREIIDGVKYDQNDGSKLPRVDINITNTVVTTPISATMYIQVTNNSGNIGTVSIGNTYKGSETEKTEAEDGYDTYYVSTRKEIDGNYASIKVQATDLTYCNAVDNGDSFSVTVKYQTYLKTASLSGALVKSGISAQTYQVPLSGTMVEKIPQKVTLSVKGNVKEYDVTDYVYTDGGSSSSDYIFSPESNELFQNNTKVGNKQIDKYMSDTVLGGWQNGKETAEIQCSVNDYKSIMPLSSKVGGDAISTSNSTLPFMFRVGNVVCPMTATVSGDKPISTFDFKWGSSTAKLPKLFRVTGISPKYDGALWQTLTLQETYPQYNVTIDTTAAKGVVAGSVGHVITSSRCIKGTISSTKPHYGDNMYICYTIGSGYGTQANVSGQAGTTYKSITKAVSSQTHYIYVYGIADDFDVTITTDFTMTPPIFASVYFDSDGTWSYRDIVNQNNFPVNCKVTVIVNGSVTARDEDTIKQNSYWDIGESQSAAANGSVGTNGTATIKAEFNYTTTQNELITRTATMQIGGKLAPPEIVYAEFYSNDGQSYIEVELFNPCPVGVDVYTTIEDQNSQVASSKDHLDAYEDLVIQIAVTSSLDYTNSRVCSYSSYYAGSTQLNPFKNSDTTYSQID